MKNILEVTDAELGLLNNQLKEIREALQQLRKVTVGDMVNLKAHAEVNGSGLYIDDDDGAPFFSENYLYPLLGKDAARRILRVVRNVQDAAGVEMDDLV